MAPNDSMTFRTSRAPRAPEGADQADAQVVPLILHRPAPAATDPSPSIAPAPHPQDAATADDEAAPLHPAAVTAPARGGKLYLVARSRGGVGATTFAVNLALALRQRDRRTPRSVAIVDLDLQFGTVASALDMTDRGGLLALAQLDHDPDQHAIRAALQTHDSGLGVLPAPRRPVPLDALDAARAEAIFAALLATHDAVVADLPPALIDWLEPLLRRSDRLFMVTDLAVTSVDCARRILDTFREDAPGLVVETVVSRERKPFFTGRVEREIAKVLDQPLTHWLPADPKRARLALDRGEPMVALAPHCGWSRRLRKIVGTL